MRSNFFHHVHKKHIDLVPKITEVLLEMQKNGEIKALVSPYE